MHGFVGLLEVTNFRRETLSLINYVCNTAAKVHLDVERMQRAANQLVGHKDFTHFAILDENDDRSPLRHLRRLDVCRVQSSEFEGEHESGCTQIGRVVVVLEADFFL